MLELKNISKTFNPNSPIEVKVMTDFNIQINEGDFITVIGGNGAGKSTMLNLISGSLQADRGLIMLNEYDISNMSENKRAPYFGRVFQDPMMGTASDMTILENLSIAYGRGKVRSLFKWSTKAKEKEFFVEELKKLDLGLEDRLYQKVGLLSGGQRQALTLLMATIRKEPSLRVIKRDYVRFFIGDKSLAKKEVEESFIEFKKEKSSKRKEVMNNKSLSIEEKKNQLKEIKEEFRKKVSKYDVTKQILLLDEHTAALDPKTAAKVLEITDKIVKDNHLTTIMVTHNMKDAIKYGNRLVMMSKGKVVVDIKDEEKSKLKVEDLLKLFQKANKDDFLSDEALLG